ncbi:hypothetical protein C4572_02545 [Candidatus Parcubacteria bacterium]|nr:MAG: hypothetical protein C4572_02545 [Candidatus Parcubacteria bacterium]
MTKKIIIIISVLAVLAILVLLIFNFGIKNKMLFFVPEKEEKSSSKYGVYTELIPTPKERKERLNVKPDVDFDGLPDEDEEKNHTDKKIRDSDNDGLTDWQEVIVWLTDPLKPDTDDDGFKDGDEVKNGYDPKK